MKIFGFFGVFSSAQELEFDPSGLNHTSTKSSVNLSNSGQDLFTAAFFAEKYASFFKKTHLYETTIYVSNSWEYGCWGQTKDDELSTGYGEPVDEIDHLFRDWKRCRECIDLDFGREAFSLDDFDFWIAFYYVVKIYLCLKKNFLRGSI